MNKTLVALTALVVMIAAGCSDNGPRLVFAADPSVTAGLASSNARTGQPVSFGAVMLCVSAPTTATIRKVAIHEPQGDVEVTAFAVRPNPMASGHEGLGGLDIGLAEYGSGFVPGQAQTVLGICPADPQAATAAEAAALSELGVEVRLESGTLGGGSSLDLTYTADGKDRVLNVPFAIWLCASTCPDNVGASPRSSARQPRSPRVS